MDDYSNMTDYELRNGIASLRSELGGGETPAQGGQEPVQAAQAVDYSSLGDEELADSIARLRNEIGQSDVPQTSAASQPSTHELLEQYYASTSQQGNNDALGDAIMEGVKGAGRAVKAIGGGIVGLGSGAVRLAGTPIRALTGWDGLHRVADSIDSGYENWGADALASELPDDDWGRVLGGFGEKMAGTAGSLGAMAAGGGLAKLGAASKAVGTAGAALQKSLPLIFGNDAAVRTYDTAKENGSGTARALGLASVNGAIHYLGFKMFENQSLNKMLGMPQEMTAMMPGWANAAMAKNAAGNTFTSLASGVRNGMFKYILAERAKGALRAGGIMGLQNFLSSILTQWAEGQDVDWGRAVSEGLGGVEEGALMEGLMGGAAMLKTPKAARKFISETLFRNGWKASNGENMPGLLHSREGRLFVMKQNPDMQARILDIVEHGGKVTKGELNAACLPPDMTEAELREFAKDWKHDLEVEGWRKGEDEFLGDGEELTGSDDVREQNAATTAAVEEERIAEEAMNADAPRNEPAPSNETAEPATEQPAAPEPRGEGETGDVSSPAPDATQGGNPQLKDGYELGSHKDYDGYLFVLKDGKRVGFIDPDGRRFANVGEDLAMGARELKPDERAPWEAEAQGGEPAPAPQPAHPAETPAEPQAATPAEASAETPPAPEQAPAPEPAPTEPPVAERPNRLRRNVKAVNFRHDKEGKTKQQPKEVTNETGNVPIEAQPEPSVQDAGRGGQQQAPQAAEGSVEGEAPRGEVPAAGEVAEVRPADAKPVAPAPAATQEQKPAEPKPVSKTDRGGQKLTGGTEEAEPEEDAAERRIKKQLYSNVPAMLDESLSNLAVSDNETADDIAALRKAAERNIKSGADDTPSEAEARSLRKRINKANQNARESKRLGLKDREKYFRDLAKDLQADLKELEKNGIGEDTDEVGWYRNADFNEIIDAIESGNASGSAHFDSYAIGRGEAGPFAEALKGIAESGVFKGKDLERFNRLAKKINDAYKRIEADIEDPRGPFGESLSDASAPKNAPASAPRAEGTTTPPKSADATQGAEPAAGGATGGAAEEPKLTQGNKLRRGKKGKKLEAQEPKADAAPKADDVTPAAEPPKPETPKSEISKEKEGAYFTLHGNETVKVDSVEDTHVWYTYVGGVLDGGKNEMTIPAWNRLMKAGELVETKPPVAEPPDTTTADATTTTAPPEAPAAKDNKLKPATVAKRGRKAKPDAEPEAAPAPTVADQTKPASQFRDENGNMKKTLRGAVERIASAIGNRTGKGAITPEEADAIVNGIAESPEAKHNRTRQFFTPLVTDAEWQNSLGVDAESAKNLRDAVVRAKTDSEMAHFFVQVDKAVKKAKDGKLLPKYAVPLNGKISEGLEKAEREGRAEAAKRLREALDVIKPVVDAVSQEDVDKFNRSARGKKLHTQLDGSDRRRGSRGKTVSLDTKDGTIDVGADGRTLEDVADEISDSSHDRRTLKPGESYGKGFTKESDNDTTGTEGTRQGSTGKGGGRGGNRVLRIEEIDGDDVFVSLLDSTGRERGEPQKMTREQWEMLAKAGKSLNDADPSNPQVGDNIMMSRGNAESPASRDAKFAADVDYQRWLKSRKANDAEPLRQRYEMEQAKALGDAYQNAVRGVDVEYVGDRDYDPARDNPNGGRELKDRDTGTVLGIFDRDTGKLKLFRGASWKTLNHEFGHATMRYAEQEAERGNRALLDKINEAIDGAMDTPLADEVRRRYPDADEATLRDEIWAALRERPSEAMQKYVKTLQGRKWYNRAWDAIKTAWRGILSRMGFNRADLSGIDKMTPDEFNEFLDKAMIGGKTLGRLETASPQSSVRMARGPVTPGPDVRIMDDEVKWLDRQGERFVDSTHNLRKVQSEVGYRDRSDPNSVGVEEVMDPKTGFVDWRKSSDIQKAIVKSNGFVQKNEHILQVRRDRATREMAKMKGLSEDAKRELVDNYLTALHAEERNRTIADRRGDTYNDDYAEGAGRSAKWARDFIANDPNVQKYKAELDRIADIVHEAVVEDLRLRHENGLLSDDEYNFYSKKWKHYVPLRTDVTEGSPESGAFNTSTATFNRSEYRTAKGRGADNIASSPFAFAFVQAHDGIGKSAKNIIGNVTSNFIDMTEAKGLNSTKVEVVAKDGSKSTKTEYRIAEVVPADVVKRGGTKFAATFADGTTAEIGSDMRLASHQDNLVLFKRPEPVIGKDGKPTGETAARLYVAKFTEGKNGRGLAVAKAITGKNMVEVPFWVQPFSKATHFLSRMNTSASPSFLTSNIFNDRNEAWRAMSARFGVLDGAKMAAKVWWYRYADGKDLKNWLENGELRPGSDVADFINGGAAIKGGNIAQGFSGETSSLKDNLARQERKARSWWERFKRVGRFENIREIASSVGDVVQSANELEELGTRYGVYHAVLDELVAKGVPREVAKAEAVTFCRGATTDFNVRGTLAPVIGSFYMFYNANVQGTRRNIQSLTDKRGVQTFATLAGVASAMTVLRYWLGNDEEREKGGERNAKNALEYQKQSAMGIPIPSGRELSILKMRGVDALIPYAATKFTEAALYDDVGAMEALADSLKAAGGEVLGVLGGNGIGNKSQISQTLAPSLADPFVQWATGTDWQGERRVKQVIDKTVPQSYNARHGTSDVFKWIAETVNDISGGSQHRKGVVDMAPEDVQLIVETLAGGLGRDITGAINTFSNVKEVAKGGSSERLFGRMPVVKSLVREYPDSTSRYFDALDEYNADKAEFKKTTELGRRAEMKKAHPYLTAQKGRVDALIEQVQELTHRERGEVKVGQKWVPMKTDLPEARKEAFRKRRLRLQAEVLRILGK